MDTSRIVIDKFPPGYKFVSLELSIESDFAAIDEIILRGDLI
jgi:hypothetical protein